MQRAYQKHKFLGQLIQARRHQLRQRRVERVLTFTVDFDGRALDQRAGGQTRQHHGGRHFVHVHFVVRASANTEGKGKDRVSHISWA